MFQVSFIVFLEKKIKEICFGFDLLFLSNLNEFFHIDLYVIVICYCLG